MKRFEIGDTVYMAKYDRHETWIVCPDCFGTKHVAVILGDGTQVIIECCGCTLGYEPASGRIKQYEYSTQVRTHKVTAVKVSEEGVEYDLDKHPGGGCYYTGTDKNVFATKQEAMAHGESLKKEHEAEENRRYLTKTKDHKSWRWNASYHRDRVKKLERDLEWHRSKVKICQAHVKEEKSAA